MKKASAQKYNNQYSCGALSIHDSITHGTHYIISKFNAGKDFSKQIIDLSIGRLDQPTPLAIDLDVVDLIKTNPDVIHNFAPVKGFPSVLQALVERVQRLYGVNFDPTTECMITPGGIKGALTVLFMTFINPADEVIIPVPNWPHYADMVKLHEGIPVLIGEIGNGIGLTAKQLEKAINPRTKIVILGDCINPTGKVYTNVELQALASVIAFHNTERQKNNEPDIQVIYDMPYESHILADRPTLFSEIIVTMKEDYAMRACTSVVSGPGKVYGMHGDRIGYILANSEIIDVAERVQVNINSFASTYGQVAFEAALQKSVDTIIMARAKSARLGLIKMAKLLNSIDQIEVELPTGGYFLFVNFSEFASRYQFEGFKSANDFIQEKAKVAGIDGWHFWPGNDEMRHWVRLNCGRSEDILAEAADRIIDLLNHQIQLPSKTNG